MILLALLAAAAPAPASVDADLRCMAMFSGAVGKAPPEQKAKFVAGIMYFVGRIDAAAPGFDYRTALLSAMRRDPQGKLLRAEAPRCVAVMNERGKMLVATGQAVSAAAAKLQKSAPKPAAKPAAKP